MISDLVHFIELYSISSNNTPAVKLVFGQQTESYESNLNHLQEQLIEMIPKVKESISLKEKISYFSNTLRFLHRSIKSSRLTSLITSSHIESSKLAISS